MAETAPIVSGRTGFPGLLKSLPKSPILMKDGPTLGIKKLVTKYPRMENPMAVIMAEFLLEQ